MLYISEIELPKGQDPEAFSAFMRDEFLPAIHEGATRVGQIEGAELVESTKPDKAKEFLWLVHFDGLDPGRLGVRIDDEAVMAKFEAFGAKLGEHVRWNEVGRWPAHDGD